MDDHHPIVYGLLATAVLFSCRNLLSRPKTSRVPVVGSPGILSSYRDAFRFLVHGDDIVKEGYKQHTGFIFRVPFLRRWNFIVSGPALIKEMCHGPADVLSMDEAVYEQMQGDFTIGPEMRHSGYHIPAVLTPLTRNLARRYPDVRDEIVTAFDDILGLKGTEWKLIHAVPAMTEIVARASNRLFVGLPLCRDPEYLKFSQKHTVDVIIEGQLIGLLPDILRPIFGPIISSRKKNMRKAMRFLGPMVTERIAMYEAHAGQTEWADKPNDLISWLLDMCGAEPEPPTPYAIIQRVLVVVMAAIHTSSLTFCDALFDLAAHPEYIEPLREEVTAVLAKRGGWSKAALGDMHKVDSFMRESQRMNGLGCLSLFRKVIHPDGHTFSDGTYLPAGSFVNVPIRAVHSDPEIVPNPHTFDPFRFSDARHASQSSQVFQQYMVTTTPAHLAFGHGKHACPGRFFAAMELKNMLAHIVLTYDIKLEGEGAAARVRPPDQKFDQFRSPNPKAKVWFRRREEVYE